MTEKSELGAQEPVAYWYERATATTSGGKPELWQNELSYGKPDTHEYIRNVRPLYAAPPPSGERLTSDAGEPEDISGEAMDAIEAAAVQGTPLTTEQLDKLQFGRVLHDQVREARFFIDHGMIHDRRTGKHVTTEPDSAFCDGIERCCELLNSLAAQPPVADGVREALDRDSLAIKIAEVSRDHADGYRRNISNFNTSHDNIVAEKCSIAASNTGWFLMNYLGYSSEEIKKAVAALAPPSSGGETS